MCESGRVGQRKASTVIYDGGYEGANIKTNEGQVWERGDDDVRKEYEPSRIGHIGEKERRRGQRRPNEGKQARAKSPAKTDGDGGWGWMTQRHWGMTKQPGVS